MADELKFDEAGALDHVRAQAVGFLRRAAMTVVRRAKELLSVQGTIKASGPPGRTAQGRFKSRKTGAVRSKPGEPPRKQTGRLRAGVTFEVDEANMTARAGTNVKYGKALELGTKKGLAPRPWLRRALAEMQSRVDQLLGRS